MKFNITEKSLVFALSATVLLLCVSPALAQENESPEVVEDPLAKHKSVFEAKPGYGDPFFPKQNVVAKESKGPVAPRSNVYDKLALKGISVGADSRLVIINNQTMAAGETMPVKTADGASVNVQVLEIKENSVVIKAEGMTESKEIFLRRF